MKTLVNIILLQTCMIAGVPRSPVEGVQTVPCDRDDPDDYIVGLVAAKQADWADIEGEEEPADDLDKKNLKQLRTIAKDEGATVEGDANKATIIAAIRAKRDAPNDRLDAMDEAQLRETAASEGVEIAEGDGVDAIIEAITKKRSAQQS